LEPVQQNENDELVKNKENYRNSMIKFFLKITKKICKLYSKALFLNCIKIQRRKALKRIG
jgi:hypothetical protein